MPNARWLPNRCVSTAVTVMLLSAALLAVRPGSVSAQAVVVTQATATAAAGASVTALAATATRPSAAPSPTAFPTAAPPRPSPSPSPTAPVPAPATATPARTATGIAPPSVTPAATSFPYAPGALAGRRIVVDPGHGAPDPGAVYNGLFESQVNLAIAQALQSALVAAGADVTLTRTTDQALAPAGAVVNVDADLQARVNLANRAGADLFVSIHGNVGADASVQGAVTFYGQEEGFASGARRTPRQVGTSSQLAAAVERELALATGAAERGTRPATFWVLGGTRAPAILVETGYLTSPDEAARLGSAAYQRRVAQGITAGIVRFFATQDDSEFSADVTLPDGAQVAPGAAVVKTWRLRNSGVTTWGPGYRLAFYGGAQLGGPDSVALPAAVPPGAEVDVSVPLQAPPQDTAAPLTGRWQLRSPGGTWFGDRVWVSLRVYLALPTDRAASLAGPDFRYFDVTGHNIGFAFRSFFEGNGGLERFGYPRTEEMEEAGWTVQYFQRAQFEYHPEAAGTPFEVQLTLLGDDATAGRRPFASVAPFPESPDDRYFAETGHGVHFAFWRYVRDHGGVESFGYPISEELYGEGGWPYAVQYFQRARLEYHPELAGTPYEVELGLLGDDALRRRGWLR